MSNKIGKLFVKGMKEPIILNEEQMLKAKRIINNMGDPEFGQLRNNDEVEIGEKWSGKKGELRYVITEDVGGQYKEVQYTPEQINEVGNMLKEYLLKETDAEFKESVEGFYKMVTDGKKILHSPYITARLNALREKYVKDNKVTDEAELRKELEQMAKQRLVGKLSKDGQTRFLIDQHLLIKDDKGNIAVNGHNTQAYTEVTEKISLYERKNSIKEYAESMNIMAYQEIAEQMGVTYE